MGDKYIYVKRIIALICVMAIFIGIWTGIRYTVNDDTTSYTRVMMHEFYSQENIDVLFCGASLCYRSFDTDILDNELGLNTFNSGSSSQNIDTTYYIIKEAIDTYQIKKVVLEISPIMAMAMNIDARDSSEMTEVYAISDYMKWSLNKIQMLLKSSPSDLYINNFLVARRNWRKISDLNYVSNLLTVKKTSAYKEYQYDLLQHESEWYAGKGYVASNNQVSEGSFNDSYGKKELNVKQINDDWFLYLNKIINHCKKNKVDLILICAPLSEYLLSCYGERYDEYHNMILEIADDAHIEFWDFCLCKEQYLQLGCSSYGDSAHLNMYGASTFSKLVAKILCREQPVDELFYESSQQKLQESSPTVLGLVSAVDEKKIVSSATGTLEYKINICPTDGEEYELQNFAPNAVFQTKEGETGTIHIMSRVMDRPDEVKDYYFSY